MENLVKKLTDFFKQLTICQILTMTKGILLLQPNWIYYTSCWIFLHMMMRVYFIKTDTNKSKKRLSLLMSFLLHLCQSCKGRSLHINVRDHDAPRATLIKGAKIYEEVLVLNGKCPLCKTIYYADHETCAPIDNDSGDDNGTKFYLNNAKYLKVGQSVWVDRVFSGGVIQGIYHFHTSSSAFTEFWNDTFWSSQKTQSRKISRRQIWHTFVQESMRMVAKSSGVTLEMENGIPIQEVTKQAFIQLGEN